ncbi:MAG: hypothetical protein Q6K90_05035 [Gloeomargarita sp. HHBFW_bins_162]
MTAESQRLADKTQPWKQWGSYLGERQWGTVREDYSDTGNAWDYFSHDQARSRAYRWGEDGLGGISDNQQLLCFALTLWNGQDPILKERLFGLTNSEGNHGEDVKEYYFYLDSTPTHSYMKYLYKYPQKPFPYDDLVHTNRHRSTFEPEYELLDTGVFDDNRYFDVFVEYAKANPQEIWIKVRAENRGSETAPIHLMPTLWFRNTWSWPDAKDKRKPSIKCLDNQTVVAEHHQLGTYYLTAQEGGYWFFTDNETNLERLFDSPNIHPFVKDAFHRYLIEGKTHVVNPGRVGTKACVHYLLDVPAGGAAEILLRLSTQATPLNAADGAEVFRQRIQEADEFYAQVIPASTPDDQKNIMRQAIASLLWTKQFYYYPVDEWLKSDSGVPGYMGRQVVRNKEWFHFEARDILLMPDKWEYPWFAAWDHVFHVAVAGMVDLEFAKEQLLTLTKDRYIHPNGQLPAYEWNFHDVNPPVHPWGVWRIYLLEKERTGKGDREFLERSFHKLLLYFTWWVNRKDSIGNNVFEGGFLGLDNIGVFDRSAPLPTGGVLEQADGSAWMAGFSLYMLNMALELALENPAYQEVATKFYQHFYYIAGAMDRVGLQADELWDEADGFFYDLLRLPDGQAVRLKVRSLVGLIPLLATTVIEAWVLERLPIFRQQIEEFQQNHPHLFANVADPTKPGVHGRRLIAIVNETKLRRILGRMLDETRFLSDYGIRSLSRYHLEHPYVFQVGYHPYEVRYEPAESTTGMFGGNSNWRGPIWMPLNVLLLQALIVFYSYYGDEFRVPCPAPEGPLLTLWEISQEIGRRLISIFTRNEQGRRPVYGGCEKFQNDPHWRDLILFYEYFHGDNGLGVGASHQTGWTAMVARLIQFQQVATAQMILEEGFKPSIE